MVVRKARITPSTFGYYRNALLDEMDKRGIKQMLSTVPIEFTADGLVCEKATDDKGLAVSARWCGRMTACTRLA